MAKKPAPLDPLDGDRDGAAGGSLPDGYRWATEEEVSTLDGADGDQMILDAEGDHVADTAEELRTLLDAAAAPTPAPAEPEVVAEPEIDPATTTAADLGVNAEPEAPDEDPETLQPRERDVINTLAEIIINTVDPAVEDALKRLGVAQPSDLTDQMRALAWATTDTDARIQLLAQADRLDLA